MRTVDLIENIYTNALFKTYVNILLLMVCLFVNGPLRAP